MIRVTPVVHFFVPGSAVTEGSKRAITPKGSRRPVVIDNNPVGLAAWRRDVKAEAKKHLSNVIPNTAIEIRCVFLLRKAKSRKKSDLLPINEGSRDLDKLVRAVFDALHEVVYDTDAAVTDLGAKKRWAKDDEQAGVHVWVSTVEMLTDGSASGTIAV